MSAPETAAGREDARPANVRPGPPGRKAPRRPLPEVAGAEVEHEWIDTGKLRMHVALAGDPAAPPLLCVHGWPQHWYMWRFQIPALAERYRVICPDLRSFGWSEVTADGNDPRTYAADLADLLDAIGIERARVMAHDWGGFASYFLALEQPQRVERLLTLNIVPPFVRTTPRALLSAWRFWYQLVAASPLLGPLVMRHLDAPKGPLRRFLYGEADWSGGAGESFSAQFRERDRARAAQRLYRHAAFSFVPRIAIGRWRDQAAELTVPTRLVFGLNDAAQSPALLEGLEQRAPAMEIVRIPDTGHFIAEERPQLVSEQALEFLAD